MEFYVYMLCDPRKEDRPFYIGKGIKDRAKSHLWNGKAEAKINPHKSNTIKAIRDAGFEPSIFYVHTGLSENEAYEIENELILFYGRINFEEGGILTNICLDARPPSPLGKPRSPETREKIGAAQRGELNHRFGSSMTDEEKEQRRAYNLQHGVKPPVRSGPMSDEQRAAIGHGNRGKKRSEEICQKLSEQRKGRPHAAPTEESKLKIAIGNALAKASPENRVRIEQLVAEGRFDPIQWKRERRARWKREQRALGRKVD